MELTCRERLARSGEGSASDGASGVLRAPDDPRILSDPRVLPNLLRLEPLALPSCDYFAHVQDDVQPFMRKVVTTWMLEVCEEQRCEEQVFPLAVNYLDRFLSGKAISRNRLQLLASSALLVASKVRQSNLLPVLLLCAYTDNSITPDELRTQEILLLQQLQWQTSAVTAYDIIEHVLARIPCGNARGMLRRHAHAMASLCYTETEFMRIRPSITATACVLSALRGISARLGGAVVVGELINAAASLTDVNTPALFSAINHIERLLIKETQASKSATTPITAPTTPTYVHDVLF